MNDTPPIPSDRALVDAARDGSDAAWAAFRARHADAVRGVAAATGDDVAGRVDRAFVELRRDLDRPSGDGEADDDGCVRALGPRAIAALTGGSYGPTTTVGLVDDGTPNVSELPALAAAFARLPESWQTVLWHRHVEHAPAAQLTARLGRSTAAIVTLQTTAERGLFDAYCAVVVESDPAPLAHCRPIIPQLGAYRRGTLPAAQVRAVHVHLSGGTRPGTAGDEAATPGCVYCARRLSVAENLDAMLAAAIVPALTGLSVERYRGVVGAPGAVVGSSALAALRSARTSRRQRVAAVVAVTVAVVAAAYFIRAPFGDLQPGLAAIVEEVNPSTTLPPVPTSIPEGDDDPALASRIEFIFPGSRQGAVYVPGGRALNLSVALSTPGPVLAGATGTIDAAITNNETVAVSVQYFLRVSSGVSFEALSAGDGVCRAEDDDGATCSMAIGAGETAVMSLRFALEPDVPDRLVVDPGVASPSLEVPVRAVADILVGMIGRGESQMTGGPLGCDESSQCTGDRREASSGDLVLAPDAEVERALLVWEGADATQPWARTVGLITPDGDDPQSIDRLEVEPVGSTRAAPFRSVADVTDMVRAAGSGRYAVVRPAESTGRGSWTLVVVASASTMPRRLVVVTAPQTPATPDAALRAEFPIAGSAVPDAEGPLSVPASVSIQGWATTPKGSQTLTVDDRPVGGDDPFGLRDPGDPGAEVRSYDLEIASAADALSIVASTTDGALRVAIVGVTVDLAS